MQNIHILNAETYLDDFDWSNPPAVLLSEMGAQLYDGTITETGLLNGMEAFCDDDLPGVMRISHHVLDPIWLEGEISFRIGFAVATSDAGPVLGRGWLIDLVTITGTQ